MEESKIKYLKHSLELLICIASSLYLTELVAASALATTLQAICVFFYFLVICLLGLLFCRKRLNANINVKGLLIAGILSLVVLSACKDFFVPPVICNTEVTITATGDKNINSQGSEIRITNIFLDGQSLILSELPLSQGWKIDEYGGILSLADESTLPLTISLPKSKEIKLSFLAHPWSGIVEIQDEEHIQKLDLYATEATDSVYQVYGNVRQRQPFFLLFAYVFIFAISYIFIMLVDYNLKLKMYR